MRYRRTEAGYVSEDRQVFLERGARMTDGGTAWLIWMAVIPSDRLEFSGSFAFDHHGNYARTREENAHFNVPMLTPEQAVERDDWMLHLADAGSLAEAKHTAELLRADRAATPAA